VRTLDRIVKVIPMAVKAIILVLGVLLLFASVAWFLLARTTRYLRRHREMLLEEVGVLQGALLPAVPAELNRLQASVAYRPAEGMAAGGDFYDAFTLEDGRVGIVVGDVAGHGRDALMHTALLRYTLRAYLEADLEPRAALQVGGRAIDRGFDTIATVALAVYDPNAHVLRYACAGHPPPVFLGDADHVPVTAASSPPIGAGVPTGLRQTTVSVPADSAVCFFTDGLIEARSDGRLLGRLGLVEIIRELGPRATASELLDRVAADADRVDDDMAACMFRVVDGPATADSARLEELEVRRGEPLDIVLRRFLVACGVATKPIANAILRADRAMRRHAGAVVAVSIGADGKHVEVRPANVESFAAAEARRDATAAAKGGR
jgi:Stage II sporulation protein E (SpoIIE)